MWTTHYGAVEPGSTMEFNPKCSTHGYSIETPEVIDDDARPEYAPDLGDF